MQKTKVNDTSSKFCGISAPGIILFRKADQQLSITLIWYSTSKCLFLKSCKRGCFGYMKCNPAWVDGFLFSKTFLPSAVNNISGYSHRTSIRTPLPIWKASEYKGVGGKLAWHATRKMDVWQNLFIETEVLLKLSKAAGCLAITKRSQISPTYLWLLYGKKDFLWIRRRDLLFIDCYEILWYLKYLWPPYQRVLNFCNW